MRTSILDSTRMFVYHHDPVFHRGNTILVGEEDHDMDVEQ
jgi:hypothetical protein